MSLHIWTLTKSFSTTFTNIMLLSSFLLCNEVSSTFRIIYFEIHYSSCFNTSLCIFLWIINAYFCIINACLCISNTSLCTSNILLCYSIDSFCNFNSRTVNNSRCLYLLELVFFKTLCCNLVTAWGKGDKSASRASDRCTESTCPSEWGTG